MDQGYEIKYPNMPYIGGGVIYKILADNPRYQDLLKRMNLPEVTH